MQVLGHSNIQTAQFYVDLVGQDMQVALDRASANGVILQLPPQGHCDGAQQLKMNRQEKVQHALAERLKKLGKVATKDSRNQSPATPESALLAITGGQAGALQTEPDDMEKTRVRGCDAVTAPAVPALQTPGGNTFPKNNGHQPGSQGHGQTNLGASLLPSNVFAFPARKAA
ncbi:hypothetical protein [Polaromonas sp. UBA4122]|uniref:hypothetical protein n=1 Tax=Polaromonas sp. UBA4122 TaxID=1947074 RepID=UPI0025D9D54F|nr:hypothetical protein [Polaromonas sp. UBA4122]